MPICTRQNQKEFSLKLSPIIMDKMLSNGTEEQLLKASKACIIAVNDSQLKHCHGDSKELSTCISHSIKDKLIGGVDVSFGDNDKAIAFENVIQGFFFENIEHIILSCHSLVEMKIVWNSNHKQPFLL